MKQYLNPMIGSVRLAMWNWRGQNGVFCKKSWLAHWGFVIIGVTSLVKKLDGVGPVDNRPSTDKLHHFVPPRKVTCDMWQVTCILSKFQIPSSYCFWFMILWRLGGKGSTLKGHRRWISSGSLVEQNSVHAILTKKLDCHSVSFWSKLNKRWSDFQKTLPFPC